MKENDIHTEWSDADFDARCKALLENRSIAAPKPRADIFAPDARKWGRLVAAALLLSAGVGIAITYDAGEQTAPSAIQEEAAEAPAESVSEQNISLPEESAVPNVAQPLEDPSDVVDYQEGGPGAEDVTSSFENAESSGTQLRESEAGLTVTDAEVSLESSDDQGASVQQQGLIEVEPLEVTAQPTNGVEEESEPNSSLPSAVNSTESSEMEDKSEPDADTPVLKLPLTVKPGGGHR